MCFFPFISFRDFSTDKLTKGFNVAYDKFIYATAGDYVVAVPRSYFHKKPNINSKLNTNYFAKVNMVSLNLDRIIDYIDQNLNSHLSLKEIAAMRYYLCQRFF
ncbi:hypothetical protein OF897_17355 [Chryseobacterium formosus]|uniref:Uncharacterized protein n=1 Tax=Chryseobacterium formosus TaxID=1537363 RepID=A0ABT3XVI9_9FLAO|nr:hypothetical protein [Chryseobacterium formosus]MCX8525685.1 hypothetical protein [Chryseobacterium formosus]